MKTKFAELALIAALSSAGATMAFAHDDYSEGASTHWISHVAETKSQPTATQPAPYGYATSGAAARVVSVDSNTRHLNVTRGETIRINMGGKSVTWTFDTLGSAAFPLAKVIPGAESITVYLTEDPTYQGS